MIFNKFSNTKRGFTLIELLVVVAIIGVLSSVVLTSLTSARSRARDAARRQTLRSIATALESYASDNGGNYPALGWIASSQGATWFPALSSYLTQQPHDPLDGTVCKWDANQVYAYAYISDGNNYKLVACAENQPSASDPMYDAQRPRMVFMVCQARTNQAYCGMGI